MIRIANIQYKAGYSDPLQAASLINKT